MRRSGAELVERILTVATRDADAARRGRLLNILLLVSIGFMVVLLCLNVGELLRGADPPAETQLFVLEDIAVLALLFGLLQLSRHGHNQVAAYVFFGLFAVVAFTFPYEVIAQYGILLAVPVLAAAFVIAPPVAFLAAAVMAAVFALIVLPVEGFDLAGLTLVNSLAFLLIALLAWQAARNLERALMVSRRQAEELQHAYLALQHADAQRTEFMTLASHELRTPLTLIAGYAGMLRADVNGEPEQRRKMLHALEEGTRRLTRLVDRMMIYTEMESADSARWASLERAGGLVPLARVVRETAQAVQHESGIESYRKLDWDVTIDADAARAAVRGDTAALRLAIDEMLRNAVKFTHDGGQIRVGVALRHPGSAGEPGEPGLASTWLDVSVTDTGIGVAPEDRERIFEKFVRAGGETPFHSSSSYGFLGGGPGLGLAIVQRVATLHAGRAWCESPGRDRRTVPGPGSTFHLLLPAVMPSAAAADAAEHAASDAGLGAPGDPAVANPAQG